MNKTYGAYTFLFLIIVITCIGFLNACANEVDAQEKQAQEWQKKFNDGKSIDVQVRVIGGAK